MPVVALEYIEVDDRGVAKVIGTRSKVRQIVMDMLNGMTPEQIHEQYPHLSMAQIHAALAYYYDHKAVVDVQIEEGRQLVEDIRSKHQNPFTRVELEARKRPTNSDRVIPPGNEGNNEDGGAAL